MFSTKRRLRQLILHHIGIVVADLNKSVQIYSNLGYVLEGEIKKDDIQNNLIAMMKSDNSPDIELIKAIDNKSTVFNTKFGYHHICFELLPNENIFRIFKEAKIGKVFTSAITAPAFNNRKVVFACLQNGTFVEFLL